MSTYDVTALGELLIDFTEAGTSPSGQRLFEQNPGGAPCNVLVALQHLGHPTAFIGKVGADMHGDFLAQTIAAEGVDCQGLVHDPGAFTTLAFVALNETGDRAFSFARKPGADTQLRPEELDRALIENSRIFHVGSLSLTDEPARAATLEALHLARQCGCILSYDPNYRANLWPSAEAAIEQMRAVVPFMDLMKVSDEECALLTGCDEPEAAAAALLETGPKVVAVTLGGAGAYVACAEGGARVDGFATSIVDTTGAGDSFWGGFLAGFLESGKSPEEVALAEAVSFARMGNAVASLCCQKRGGIPAMPGRAAVEALLS